MSTLRELLDELTEQLGPPDERMVAEVEEELTTLVHRARTADLPVRHGTDRHPVMAQGATRTRIASCIRDPDRRLEHEGPGLSLQERDRLLPVSCTARFAVSRRP